MYIRVFLETPSGEPLRTLEAAEIIEILHPLDDSLELRPAPGSPLSLLVRVDQHLRLQQVLRGSSGLPVGLRAIRVDKERPRK